MPQAKLPGHWFAGTQSVLRSPQQDRPPQHGVVPSQTTSWAMQAPLLPLELLLEVPLVLEVVLDVPELEPLLEVPLEPELVPAEPELVLVLLPPLVELPELLLPRDVEAVEPPLELPPEVPPSGFCPTSTMTLQPESSTAMASVEK